MVKKRNLSELAQQHNRAQSKKRLNPFEVHINREKQKVLGRKNKNDRGIPGVSRAKAINKRKRSLLQEYKLKNKNNVFLDKRIGERNSGMSVEDKAMARFAMERMKAHRKKDIYNLNDEVLTHGNQTLQEIENFDDPKSDDESDDGNMNGKLDKNFVEEVHFGGGILSKSDAPLSRKDLINQLIAESKKRKAEKQKIREQTIDLTEKLDSEWRDLLPIMSASKKTEDTENTKADDYDIAVQQLKFAARGNPTEKLKSEEQIEQEEKEKLEELEADRLARMKGFVSDTSNRSKHRSADDLDDGFLVEAIGEDDNDNDANSILNNADNNEENSDDDEDNENKDDDNDDEDKDDDDDNNDNDNNNELKNNVEKKSIKDVEARKNNSKDKEKTCSELNIEDTSDGSLTLDKPEDENLEEESEDDLSDLKKSESSSEDENEPVDKRVTFASNLTNCLRLKNQSQDCLKSILKQNNSVTHVQNSSDENRKDDITIHRVKEKEIMEVARKKTLSVPETFEDLEKLLKDHNAKNQSIIIDRIIKDNHSKLNGKNKEKLSDLFIYLLQYINNCAYADNASDLMECFDIFNRLCPHLYDLAHINPENAKECMQEIIKEKHEKFQKNKKRYPSMDTIILFKLVSLLFPTSDFRHPVTIPTLVFMSQILLRSNLKRVRTDMAKGLFICTLMLEYTVLSKRFPPSAINFLRGIIYAAVPTDAKTKVLPPFKATCKNLVKESKESNIAIDPNSACLYASDLIDDEIDDNFRIRALLTAVNLVKDFKTQLQELDVAYPIFEPIIKLLKSCQFKNYPSNVKSHIKTIRKELESLRNKKLEYIVLEKKKPKPLRLYKPKIVTVYDGKQHKPMSKEKAEREKLVHKYKREFKGAVREIRKDRDFLAKVQIAEQIRSDAERKRKVNEIFGEAATQQNEFKKFKKKK